MTTQTVQLDGAMGEGGGQILRSALGLSLVTGRPFAITNIRAGRSKPGLRHQHLTAVLAAADVGNAEVRGATLGSMHLEFVPREVRAGTYVFQVGTAGSATLVAQTVLPALMTRDGESILIIEGGTHNPGAPPFEFLAKSYLPLIARMGPRCDAQLERYGFAPRGGGRIRLRVVPSPRWTPLVLTERGPIHRRSARALVANLPPHIAERESRTIARLFGWPAKWCDAVELDDCSGTGNIVLIQIEAEHVTEVFASQGERGVPAEEVAKRAYKEAAAYLDAGVPVGPHLEDQLLLPMAIGAWQGTGGGRFTTTWITPHTETHIEVIRAFLGVETQRCQNGQHIELQLIAKNND